MLEKDLEIKSTNKQRRKLVDYLNEYEEGISGEKGHFTYESRFDEVHIISQKFGFIKWLVDKDKIDFDIIVEKIGTPCLVWYNQGEINCVKDVSDYEQVIVLLSISDNPISDLISYLR